MLRRKGTGLDEDGARPLPAELLAWQVRLRAWTMSARDGMPHVGVAPLLVVRHPGVGPGVTVHGIICGLLPAPDQLEAKTRAFRAIYEETAPRGARATHERGLAYLEEYYRSAADFDATSITTLLPRTAAAVRALEVEPRCALVFYVFDLAAESEVEKTRCLQVSCRAELHESGPVYDNVWWHNALFHGKLDEHVVVRFRHERTDDTIFGGFQPLVE